MAASSETITLHTAPDRWLSFFLSDQPYQRVLTVIETDGTEHASPAFDQYNPDDINRRELPSTPELSQRLADFFDTYLISRRGRRYNCHKFALWMSGVEIPEVAGDSDWTEIAEPMMEDGTRHEGPLALGKMGIIGHKMGGHPRALHSVVGLGEDNPECLQVMGLNGYLGIDTYDHALELCMPDHGMPQPGFGLYASPV
jgi:hypothetical protein